MSGRPVPPRCAIRAHPKTQAGIPMQRMGMRGYEQRMGMRGYEVFG